DVDLYRRVGDGEEAEHALRAAAAIDLLDLFRFEPRPGRTMVEAGGARRVALVAYLGVTEYARFHVDVVTGRPPTGPPEQVQSLLAMQLPGLASVPYRVYPLADHIADKVSALLETHPRLHGAPVASSRYRDLADLVVVARRTSVEAATLRKALQVEMQDRGLPLPERLSAPVGRDWPAGYARVAAEVPELGERDLAAAIATASGFIDPILQETAAGAWHPAKQHWSSG
ncbi:MAG: nucleotidyl transferase AbiEii/AbiGii toxin family protein, partial [Candidatus Dormibacteraeota bacterium]|nr:nucleotidyl transferase AbiEii/AbiGii toxin family protein [Candidatus Dormibacteraeota bacterium]